MRLRNLFTLFLSATAVTAADPANCNTSDKKRTGSDFVLREKPVNGNVASLSSYFKARGKIVSVADVFDDGNHQMTTNSAGHRVWESKPDFDDLNTAKWVPQGISSTADALDVGIYQGKDGWVVSWHNADDTSARVTFVDKATGKYRHVLLVYPHAADDFRPVPVHAGGIVWYGNTLWVVDTKNGIRIFDLDNVWRVDDGDEVGKKSGGGYSAAGYRYVIPQLLWYEWTPSFNFQFSYVSLDRSSTPDSILVGEYRADSDAYPIRMAKWDLDYTTRRLKTDSANLAKATWAYCVNIERMQGAAAVDGRIFISRSNGASGNGDIWGWTPGGAATLNAGKLPPGPEDFSYDKRTKEMFTATEHAGKRYIVKFKASSVNF